jgi:hypothetical protein
LTETVSGPCKSQAGASTAAGVRTDARRVFCTDCKSKQGIVAKYVSLQRAPHALDIARILRALSRMRAEPVGESSLTILEFNLWINQTPIQLVEPRGIPLQHLARTSSTR